MRIHAILLAGGDGNRFGAEMPKQFVRLAGEQILLRSVRSVAAAGIDRLVIVSHPDWLEETTSVIAGAGLTVPTSVVAGGRTRNESTRNGLLSLDADDEDVVVVHDAVRPLVPIDVIVRAIEPVAAGTADSTDTVIPSADTLVIVDGDRVVEIPDRSRYRRGQTPQVFRKSVLAQAYDAAAAAAISRRPTTAAWSFGTCRAPASWRSPATRSTSRSRRASTSCSPIGCSRCARSHPTEDPVRPHSLTGARLYVVGGTNGIGLGIAEEARRQGAEVEVDGRSMGLDVRDYAVVASHVEAAATRMGGLDHVIVTAGVLRIGPVMDTEPADLAEVIDVNLTGTLNVARAAYPHLRASAGSLTVFASSSFTRGRPDYVAYSASKAAVVNLAQGLAEEWCDDGVRVNAISPERTDTPMRRRAFPAESRSGMLSTEEVATATLRLIGSDLTGQVFDIKRHDSLPTGPSDEPEPVATGRP